MEKNYLKFTNGQEMYDYISSYGELYNEKHELYIFEYNDAGVLCVYSGITKEQVDELAPLARENGDLWSAFLGAGGSILEDSSLYEKRYDPNFSELYLKPSFDCCDQACCLDGWLPCDMFGNAGQN